MTENRNFPNLISIISIDLLSHSKLFFILLIFVLISAISVVIVTCQTRQLVINHEQILLEKDALEIENRNLMLEETVLGNLQRIEHIAIEKFNMQYVSSVHEQKIIYFED